MDAKHTPGPWLIDRDDSGQPNYPLRVVNREFHVCGDMMPGQIADAHLIAAAPELLDNCIRALAAWDGTGPAIALDDLRAAIAKATGSAS